MADVFFQEDAKKLLEKKHIVLFGDSNTRALYKDLLWLLNRNTIINQSALKTKAEDNFMGDKLGKHTVLSRGREFQEERIYENDDIHVEFHFITKCYHAMIVDMMEDISLGLKEAPDIIYINSTLWDITRWGPNGVVDFKDNLLKLARLFKSSLPASTLIIWGTALPLSSEVKSSLLIKQLTFLQRTVHFDAMEANHYARQVMVNHGFDVLDLHFHMRMQMHRIVKDGIHFFPAAVRLQTNLLLTHIALTWDVPLPNRVQTILLDKAKGQVSVKPQSPTPKIKTPTILSKPKGDKQKMFKKPTSDRLDDINDHNYKMPHKAVTTKRNNQRMKPYSKNWRNQGLTEALHRPGRVKRVGSRGRASWKAGSHRVWDESPPSSSNMHGNVNPWMENINFGQPQPQPQPQVWSQDYWPEEQPHFNTDARFNDNDWPEEQPHFNTDRRFADNDWSEEQPHFSTDPRFTDNARYFYF